jgi:hypothetical protein
MNILRSRLEGADRQFAENQTLTDESIKKGIRNVDVELGMIHDLIESGERPSLKFVNDTYLIRHHLTQARIALFRAQAASDESSVEDMRERDESLRKARACYRAAFIDLDAAELQLPSAVRTIDGESFWDRFYRVSDDREKEAKRSFIAGRDGKK